jgi:glycosyltransferase involved in cell wall biosynthesis
MTRKRVDLSVVITAHNEGILIHKTILSVQRAIKALGKRYTADILLHLDKPDTPTREYVQVNKDERLECVKIYTNEFGDLGSSRNFAIEKATGRYIATIDADDLMSRKWLLNALDTLEDEPRDATIAHSEFTVVFGDDDVVVDKYNSTDRDHDALMSVWSNRWNSVVVVSRKLMLDNPYPTNSPGFGYEDWWFNNTMLAKDVKPILVPETAIFVRRRDAASEWRRQIASMAVLHANELLSFKNIRSLKPVYQDALHTQVGNRSTLSTRFKVAAKSRLPRSYALGARLYRKIKKHDYNQVTKTLPEWLEKEWRELHYIDTEIVSPLHRPRSINWHPAITEAHKQAGALYKAVVDQLRHNKYDYLMFAPWLIVGGADQYIVNYANTIAKLRPKKRVLVLTTLPSNSTYQEQLAHQVDFVDFGNLSNTLPPEVKSRVIEHLIENANIRDIHIVNSEFGYDFVNSHRIYIKATDRKVVATSFSQSVDENGRLFGYSHTHLPKVYDILSAVTSDNQAILDMWVEKYGFDPAKLLLHRQAVEIDDEAPKRKVSGKRLKVLWAARISPEKLPELVPKIGELIADFADIDMYGYYTDKRYRKLLNKLPANVKYLGKFENGLATIVEDNPYDVYLYTSKFDGTPNALLESMKLGLPIVASAVGGIPEFIIDEKSGLLVDDILNPEAYAAAIRRMTDATLRNKLSSNANEITKSDFSPKLYGQKINDYLDLIGY